MALGAREQASGFLAGAVLALACIFVDGPAFGWRADLIAVRVVWATLMGLAAWLVIRGSRRTAVYTVLGSSVVSTCGFLAVMWLTGGLQSPYLIWASGFCTALAPYSRRGTLVSAVLMCAGLAVMARGKPYFGLLVGSVALAGLTAVYTAVMFHTLRRREKETQEQLAESERRRTRAERMALVGQLAAGVAHEVNNPLAYVSANLNCLASEWNELQEAERAEIFQETREGVRRIARIVNDLKDFGRDAALEVEPTAVRELVDEVVRMASVRTRGTSVVIDVEAPDALPVIALPRRNLAQVLLNLLVNAVDALESAPPPAPRVRVRVGVDGARLRVTVEDNGNGIPPELKDRIFEPFFTTKPPGKGTGLGLALSREYCVRAGGALTLLDRAQGAAFCVELPSQPAAAAGVPLALNAPVAAGRVTP